MDRLELIRIETDKIIQKLANEENRKFAYLHSYGVSQCAIYLATVRKLDVELDPQVTFLRLIFLKRHPFFRHHLFVLWMDHVSDRDRKRPTIECR